MDPMEPSAYGIKMDFKNLIRIREGATWADIQYRYFYHIKPSKPSVYTGLEDEESWTGTPNY